jgi:heme/copper-type cytochrome/quinol oxidase subunit 3
MADPAVTFEDDRAIAQMTSVGSAGRRASGWYGMLALIVTEAALFLYLQFSYYYLLVWNGRGFLPPENPGFRLSGPNTVILLLSSVAVWWGEEGTRKGRRGQAAMGIGVAFLLGAAFMGIQVLEWAGKPYRWDTHAYGSLYFTITGFHMLHVAAGLIVLLALFVWNLLGYFDVHRHAPVAIGGIYWHFVDVVWLTVFFTFYVTPYLR